MQSMSHAMAAPPPKGARIVGLLAAGLLQLLLMWVLIEGLTLKVWPVRDNHMSVSVIRERIQPAQPLPAQGPIDLQNPQSVSVEQPTIQVQDDTRGDRQISTIIGPGGPPADRAASAIGETHTTPPYPVLALRLGEEGSVWLHLRISPQGTVSEAIVVRSSGFRDLDEAAQTWILANWRYRPALRGGAVVGSESDVQVRFDLKNAR